MLRGLFFLFISIQMISIGSAKVVEKRCIQNLEAILQYVPDTTKEKTLFAFSWDLTVSANIGLADPLGEKAKISQTLHKIGGKGAKIILLASRLDGQSKMHHDSDHSIHTIEEDITDMAKELNQQDLGLEKYGDLADNSYWEYPIPQTVSNVIAQDNIVFAGAPPGPASAKGWVVKTLIDQNRLKEKPDVILFIDRDSRHLPSFEKAFEDSPEKVTLFHYPHGEDCEKGYTMKEKSATG